MLTGVRPGDGPFSFSITLPDCLSSTQCATVSRSLRWSPVGASRPVRTLPRLSM